MKGHRIPNIFSQIGLHIFNKSEDCIYNEPIIDLYTEVTILEKGNLTFKNLSFILIIQIYSNHLFGAL